MKHLLDARVGSWPYPQILDLPGATTLANYGQKSFITLAPGRIGSWSNGFGAILRSFSRRPLPARGS
jgi:hypothetical protein